MLYGIKHDNGTIEAISKFRDVQNLPLGFEEITKSQYESFIDIVQQNTFVTYNSAAKSIDIDSAAEANLINTQQKENIKSQMRTLSTEIDLLQRMSEDTTAKQAEFDALLVEYNRTT